MGGKLLFIGFAGAGGALARYALAGLVQKVSGGVFPWGTFVVNIAGCFAFGLIWAITEKRLAFAAESRVYLLTGFLGAFTTFSTFAFETGAMMRDGEYLLATANLGIHNILGICALFIGLALGTLI
ncbi:MAG TPA: CrcB family protein [Candidatus Hydrogenedentes bacterium]|jgi:CrcB protein|nr:CrcB family protein [Candidatus Hydrogenedentota bacterium]HPJ99422.1 CrcB family protein [Candidatus Hydrogenedentota bacterium]